jgi:hypothetical protein
MIFVVTDVVFILVSYKQVCYVANASSTNRLKYFTKCIKQVSIYGRSHTAFKVKQSHYRPGQALRVPEV